MKQSHLRPIFVEFIPETLDEGVLYVAMEYRTTAHRCCCGCGRTVYLPLSPTQWRLTFDGESIWINPSVGSWSLPCRSHYWIRGNRILWAQPWTNERVAAARANDRRTRDQDFVTPSPVLEPATFMPTPAIPVQSRWARVKAFIRLK